MNRSFPRVAALFVTGLLTLFSLPSGRWLEAGDSPARRPNVILFLVDDMGWMDSSACGSRYYETPHMERLAQRGMRFTDAYAMPLCSPTRASLLSGQHSARHGVTSASGHQPPQAPDAPLIAKTAPPNRRFIYPESRNYLRPEIYTLAECLRDAGYQTGHFGKWHLGLTAPHWPEQQGFQVAFHGKPDPGPGSYFAPYSFRQFQSFPDGPDGEYITDRLTDEALRFISDNRDRPFFLNLWQYGVHGPWGHKIEYTRGFSGKTDPRGQQGNPIMASMLKSIDDSLGRVLDQLEELKLSDNTILIFYSDNGGNTHSNIPEDRKRANIKPGHPRFEQMEDWKRWAGDRPPTSNAPLRDGKGRLYEGGIRVPLMVLWPEHIQAGSTSNAVVGPIDFYPTLLELLGLPQPDGQKLDGESFAPVLLGKGSMKRPAYFTWFPHLAPGAVVRQGDWKLIRRYEPDANAPEGFELFNLRDDLSESTNLAPQMPEKVRELNSLIDRFLNETGALQPVPNPTFNPATSGEPGGKARGAAKKAGPLAGWVAQSCQAEVIDGALRITSDRKSPFLGYSGLKLAGPVTITLKTRQGSGPARVQWRVHGQEQFPESGQIVEYRLQSDAADRLTRVAVPVEGELLHVRLYLPASSQPVEIESIEIRSSSGRSERWSFAARK